MQNFAAQLAADAKKNGLDKAAAAQGLHVVTTDYVAKDGVIAGLADGSGLLDAGVRRRRRVQHPPPSPPATATPSSR